MLLRLCRQYPDLQLTMTFTDHFVDPIEEGIDLLIRFGGLHQAEHLVARRLGSQRLVTCASPEYLQAHGVPRTVEELAQHRSIVGFRHGQPVWWRIGSEEDEGTFIPNAPYQLNDGDAVIEAAIAGLGICQMPVHWYAVTWIPARCGRCWMRTCNGTSISTRCGHRRATCGPRCATWWMN